jgi:NhaA family Na+:H+ antiporter
MPSSLKAFFKMESLSGIVLFLAAVAAMLVANSPLSASYHSLLEVQVGFLSVEHWINDGLMAFFFFVVGLEIKAELTVGHLASFERALLPVAGAIGGMVVPALIYFVFVQDRGWGIPIATDIAFAVGVLSLFGKKIPAELKVFLLALAIADDLGAVLVIALFYTDKISPLYLVSAITSVVFIFIFVRLKFRSPWLHVPLGLVVWFLVHESGVHATIAGAVLGFLVPEPRFWIRRLHAWSSFVIMPLFAFANAGLSFSDVTIAEALTHPLVNGISCGLLIGKPLGIFGASWLAVRSGYARLGFAWRELAGVACLGGIGFSVSLFIAGLALKEPHALELAKLGIVKGSLLSAVLGCFLLIYFRAPDRKA